jgi:hypothetical protein
VLRRSRIDEVKLYNLPSVCNGRGTGEASGYILACLREPVFLKFQRSFLRLGVLQQRGFFLELISIFTDLRSRPGLALVEELIGRGPQREFGSGGYLGS